MKIYTSFYNNIDYINKDIVTISIAAWKHSDYKGLEYKKLAPKWCFFEKWKHKIDGFEDCYKNNEYYIKCFNSMVLDKLDPLTVYRNLEEMSDGKDVVLLCYEEPQLFCHRHLVAEWLSKRLGILVEEYKPEVI